jgi:cytochrome c
VKKSLQWVATIIVAMVSCIPMFAAAADAPASAGKALAAAKHCDVCHDTTTPKVGPAFRDVARRYAGLSNGREMIVRIIRAGSGSPSAIYHWGSSTMPPDTVRVPVNDAEAGVLADYVLSFK